jgi:hypothetical protein
LAKSPDRPIFPDLQDFAVRSGDKRKNLGLWNTVQLHIEPLGARKVLLDAKGVTCPIGWDLKNRDTTGAQ